VIPFTLLGKRRGVKLVIGVAGIIWGTSATCFAAVKNYNGAFACRFFIGFGGASRDGIQIDVELITKRLGSSPLSPFTWRECTPRGILELE
jgi:MFS family permease